MRIAGVFLDVNIMVNELLMIDLMYKLDYGTVFFFLAEREPNTF